MKDEVFVNLKCGVMCGILVIFDDATNHHNPKFDIAREMNMLHHRGPDSSGVKYMKGDRGITVVGHTRLQIIGLDEAHDPQRGEVSDSGEQPFLALFDGSFQGESSGSSQVLLSVNGEIFNYKDLKAKYKDYNFETTSDCEVIIPCMAEYGAYDAPKHLDGEFAYVAVCKKGNKKQLVAARDPIGVVPLYMGTTPAGTLCFASEMKVINQMCSYNVHQFPPGCVFTSDEGLKRYIEVPTPYKELALCDKAETEQRVRNLLIAAVEKRLMVSEAVDFGMFLSGGLDSSLVASIANSLLRKKGADHPKRMKTFSIGLRGSPDLKSARQVAEYLDTEHYEYTFTIKEGMNAVRDVIYYIESYDVTTIRASTPMYLLAKVIRKDFPSLKMCLSGEGSDEAFGGYLYFKGAPTEEAFYEETIDRVHHLHKFDCLRANKSTMASGLELRFPFLDKHFLKEVMNIHPINKVCNSDVIEKQILRSAFDCIDPNTNKPWLPKSNLWRQKEAFSDGVGYTWVNMLKKTAEKKYSDLELNIAKVKFVNDPPLTKEALYFMHIFENHFGDAYKEMRDHRWLPRWTDTHAEPSARALKWHLT